MAVDPFSNEAAAQFLQGGGVAAKWPKVGYVVEGTVTGWKMSQQTDYDTGEDLFWVGKKRVPAPQVAAADKNRPAMQLVMDLKGQPTGETWEGLQNIRRALPDDDGARVLYVRGGLQKALSKALKDSNGKLEEGAFLRIERIADIPNPDKKKQAAHAYTATWTAAASNAAPAEDFLAGADEDENPFG